MRLMIMMMMMWRMQTHSRQHTDLCTHEWRAESSALSRRTSDEANKIELRADPIELNSRPDQTIQQKTTSIEKKETRPPHETHDPKPIFESSFSHPLDDRPNRHAARNGRAREREKIAIRWRSGFMHFLDALQQGGGSKTRWGIL